MDKFKQVYIYGGLDRITYLTRSFGFSWGLGGWLLTPFIGKIDQKSLVNCAERLLMKFILLKVNTPMLLH